MASRQAPRNPTFWFIPGMLVCVVFITGLCLFFIRRQLTSEEDRLHQMERFSLEQTQQLFRRELEDRWQMAVRQFPQGIPEYVTLQEWDHRLTGESLGFCLDSSGLLIYPAYEIYSGPALGPLDGSSAPISLVTGRLSAITLALEGAEASTLETERQAGLIDSLLQEYGSGSRFLTPMSLNWLVRLEEQCRRRNDQESWLHRESQLTRLVKQTQFAERFLARLNLLLRKNLYKNPHADLPTQYLTSDLNDDPVLVICKFMDRAPLGLFGLAINLERICSNLEKLVAKASWSVQEVRVQIQRESLSSETEKLAESRVLDPWAPQYVVWARPRDPALFQRRAWQKNLLYLATVLLSVFAFALVLFFGNRSLREQDRLSKLRTDFLTNVSHELKTPLTAIRLHAETLERIIPAANATAIESVETIVGEADRLGFLIGEVLEFTRLENDKKKFVWETVDLVTIIRESVRLFSHQLEQLGFELLLDLPASMTLERADRDALKQTAMNLISNSLKFSPERRTLIMKLRRNGKRALWEVEDHGIGIPPKDLPHVFEKFYRGTTLDPAMSGTGLGLTLCKAFVEAHGGEIRVESNPGHGSRFIIELPLGTEPLSSV
jgi:signal transduction histidine kinase